MKILFFFGLSTWFVFSACNKKTDTALVNYQNPNIGVSLTADLTYLALGDSYTIGQSVEAYQNFPNQLIDKLKASNKKVSGKIIAQTGWTTADLSNAIKNTSLATKYDFVSLLIGVNNQYRGYDISNYRKEFIELLQISIKYAGGNASHVFVLSIPDYSVTPFVGSNFYYATQIATEIDAYNQINKEETLKLNANYLDITPISRLAKNQTNLIANDGLHPSAIMYQEWVKFLAPMVISKL